MSTSTAPQVALDLGHQPEWDPPASGSNVQRWTCECFASVLRSGLGDVYGTATEIRCPDEEQRGQDREAAEVRDEPDPDRPLNTGELGAAALALLAVVAPGEDL